MYTFEKWLLGIVVSIPIILLLILITGLHINTGSGQQTGYISAVEKTGIIWKTGRVYMKPTLESTQEDVYCVIDEEVYAQLKQKSVSKENVTVKHFSWFSAGLKNCAGEEAVIEAIY